MWQLKKGFWGFLLNISKTVQLIFTKLMSFLGNCLYYLLKLKDWRQVIHCCHGNQFMRDCWAKNHDLREEKWHFYTISNWYCVFELRFEIRSLKLPLTPNFSVIHPKTRKQWRLSSCRDIKMTIYYVIFCELQMTSSNFFKFHKISTDRIFLLSFCIIWPASEKILENLPLWSRFKPSTLRSRKVWWRSVIPFLRYLAKTSRGQSPQSK